MSLEFHTERKIWSEIKHQILKNYLHLWVSKLASRNTVSGPGQKGNIYCVDGFAGQGKYEDGAEGSPLIAAKFATEASGKLAGVLRCINVEVVPTTFENLQKFTEPYVNAGIVQNFKGEFQEILPEILKLTEGKDAMFFIDPLGPKGADLDPLELISKRTGITEVLVRFDDINIKRILGRIRGFKQRSGDSKSERAAASLEKLLEGLGADRTKIEQALDGSPIPREEFVSSYVNLIVHDKQLFDYGLAYPIRNPKTSGHHYFMVHFCNHPDGYIHMANFMAQAERSTEAQAQGFLLDPNQAEFNLIRDGVDKDTKEKNIRSVHSALPSLIKKLGSPGQLVQARHIYAEVVHHFKWKFLRVEWQEALKRLEGQGQIQILNPLGKDSAQIKILK